MARAMATAGLAPPPRASTPRFRLGPSRPPPSRRPRRVVVRAKSARYPASVRAPMPLPEAVATGLSCAVSGSRAALASPSDAWKPLTAATLVTALALESAGFFAAYALLHPDDDAGVVSSVVGTLALAATDVAWLLVAPVIAVAVVQQVLPLLGEKLFFDGMRATAAPGPRAAARLDALLASPGLGLRGLGVAAGRSPEPRRRHRRRGGGPPPLPRPGCRPGTRVRARDVDRGVRARVGAPRPVLRQGRARVRGPGARRVG